MSTDRKTIAIPFSLGSATPSQIAMACAARGYQALFLVNRSDPESFDYRELLHAFGSVIVLDSFDEEHIAADIHADGVVTFADANLSFAARLAAKLQVPFIDVDCAQVVTDKLASRERLNARGVGKVAVREIAGGGEILPADLVFPQVLKPRWGAGSRDTHVVGSGPELQAILGEYSKDDTFVLEQYIPGVPFSPDQRLADYLSVESYVFDGDITHLGITGRLPLAAPARETGLLFPLTLAPGVEESVVDHAKRSIEAMGITWGLVHTEIKMSPAGPQTIEVNARLGGGLANIIPLAGGVNPVELAIDIAAGVPPTAVPTPQACGLHLYVQPPMDATMLATDIDPKAIQALPGVVSVDLNKHKGDPVSWRHGSADRVMDIWMTADSVEHLLSHVEEARHCTDQLLVWNDAAPTPRLIGPILACAEDNPDRTAIVYGDQILSYSDLVSRAHAMAKDLTDLGVGPEYVVAIVGHAAFDTIVAILATQIAGGAFMLIDPHEPQARQSALLGIAQPQVLIDGQSMKQLDGRELTDRLPRRSSPAAYVAFTSGTTGTPKATVIEEDSVVNYFQALQERCHLGAGDRQLQFASIGFDIAIEEIFLTFRAGATLVLRPGDYVFGDVGDYLDLCERYGITVSNLPTGVWNRWGSQLSAKWGRNLPPGIRLSIIGGEKASEEALRGWVAAAGSDGLRVLNTYGPTETAIAVTASFLDPAKPVTLGRGIEGVDVWLCDPDGTPAGSGPGEIVISGKAVGRGYIGVDTGAFQDIGGRWSYRTGDRGYFDADGELHFEGRVDSQVKVRGGYRVEPDEIQSVIQSLDQVSQSHVCALRSGEQLGLAAFIVPHPEAQGSTLEATIRDELASRFPVWLIPRHIVVVKEIPLTGRGKVDTAQLHDLVLCADQERKEQADEVELIRRAWVEAVGKEPMAGRSFFESGGNSVAAVQLVEKLADYFDEAPELIAFYGNPTMEFLMQWYGEKDSPDATASHLVSGTTIIEMRAGSTDTLWCFLPPLSGAVTRYARISQLFPPGDTVWAMETPSELSHKGMDALIDGLVDILTARGVSSFRRIHFAGYSLGGVFAYEMARKTQPVVGEETKVSAFLIDPPNPYEAHDAVPDAFRIFVNVGLGIDAEASSFVTAEGFDLDGVAEAARQARTLPRSAKNKEVHDAWQVYASNATILDDYQIRPGVEDAWIILSSAAAEVEGERGYVDVPPTGPWRDVIPATHFSATPVPHFELLAPGNDEIILEWMMRNVQRMTRP